MIKIHKISKIRIINKQISPRKKGLILSLPLEGGGNPSEQKARDAVDGRSFSWHKVTKIHYARVLLHPTPSGHVHAAPSVCFADVSPYYGELPSRREPFVVSTLSPTEVLKICCRNNALRLPSPVGEGVTDR